MNSNTSTLPFQIEEYEQRVAKAHKAMQNAGVDLIIVSDPSNMAWLTGYDGWSFYVHQCVIVGPDRGPIWFGRGQDANGARRTTWLGDDRIIGYPDHYVQSTERHPMDYLAEQIAAFGWSGLRIGVEMDNYWFSAAAFAALQAHLPNATFVDTTSLVNWQRAVKSTRELDYMKNAARLVERMHRIILDKCEPGYRKCDIAADIFDAGLRYDEGLGFGGDYPAIVPLLPSGSEASAPHLTWSDRTFRQDEGAYFEVAGVFRRYHCPLSRTIFLGRPPQHFLDAEQAVLEGMDAGLEAAKTGNLCEDIANAFFAVLRKHGIEKDSRTGYPIGLSYPPDWGERTMSLRPGDKTVLEKNMTFHFMTGLWKDDWGLAITESIVIGDSGPDVLADVPRKLVVKN